MILSFEITADHIGIVSRDGGVSTVISELALGRGSMQDGYISDMENVFKRLANELSDRNVKARQCEFLLPASFALTRELTLPKVSDAKLMPLISAQIEQSLPDIKNYVLDYIEFASDAADKRTLLAVLLPVRLVEQYLNLASRLELKCTGIDLRFAKLRRTVRKLVNDRAFIVVDLLPGEAEVSLFEEDKVFVKSRELTERDNTLADWGITFASAGPDSAEQADMLAGIINSLIQFQTSRNRDIPVENIYAVGLTQRYKEMLGLCATVLNRSITGLTVENQALDTGVAAEG